MHFSRSFFSSYGILFLYTFRWYDQIKGLTVYKVVVLSPVQQLSCRTRRIYDTVDHEATSHWAKLFATCQVIILNNLVDRVILLVPNLYMTYHCDHLGITATIAFQFNSELSRTGKYCFQCSLEMIFIIPVTMMTPIRSISCFPARR